MYKYVPTFEAYIAERKKLRTVEQAALSNAIHELFKEDRSYLGFCKTQIISAIFKDRAEIYYFDYQDSKRFQKGDSIKRLISSSPYNTVDSYLIKDFEKGGKHYMAANSISKFSEKYPNTPLFFPPVLTSQSAKHQNDFDEYIQFFHKSDNEWTLGTFRFATNNILIEHLAHHISEYPHTHK